MSARRPAPTEQRPTKRNSVTESNVSVRLWDLLTRVICDAQASFDIRRAHISIEGAPAWIIAAAVAIVILRIFS
jgi:hypothetical protein